MSRSLSAFHAFKWSVFGEAASKIIGPLVFLILARILVPEDFGVVAAATVIISFSQVLWEAGLAKALIQRQSEVVESANVVFWLNLALGGIVFVLLTALAPVIASFFKDDRIAPVARMLALQIPFAALASVHIALLQKELRFRTLFNIRLLTTAAPGIASIPLAMIGYGYWALVAGVLAGQVAQTVALWLGNSWRPQLRFNQSLARDLLKFGRWVMLSAIVGWFYTWMDAVVVGHFLGPHDMGIYRSGNTLVTMILGVIFAPLLPVLYSVFSRSQHQFPVLRDRFRTVVRAIALVSMPVAFLMFSLQDQIGETLFGPEWDGIGFVIGMLALTHGFSWIVGANGEVYRAIGRPQVETWAMSVTMLPYLAGYLFAIQFGLEVFASSRLVLTLIGISVHVVIASRVLGISPADWLRSVSIPLVCSLVMYLVITQLLAAASPTLIVLAMYSAIGLAVYGLMIATINRSFIRELWALSVARPTS